MASNDNRQTTECHILKYGPREYKFNTQAWCTENEFNINEVAARVKKFIQNLPPDTVHDEIESDNYPKVHWYHMQFATLDDALVFDLAFAKYIKVVYNYG